MHERTAALLGKRLKQKLWISTFHSLCVRILREEAHHLGYPNKFAIYDRGDQESAARSALREIRVPDKTLSPGDLVNRISRWKSAGVAAANAGESIENDLDFLAAAAYRRYQRHLKSRGALDFDDLLMLTRQLFIEFPDALQRQQARFDHVQIDEYQDTNGLQFAIIEALVKPHRCLCVVGDDDQSIYGWRGAEVRHILEFHRIFPGAKIVRLEDNYRSRAAILDVANRLVAHNPGRHEKQLRASRRGGNPVRFVAFPDEQVEAEHVIGEIQGLIEEFGVRAGDVAILFRTNEQPRLFEAELRRRKIRYLLIGGQSFYDRREIRDMLSYLKVLVRPDDEVSLLRIINTPNRGIGDATVEKLLARAVRDGVPLWQALPAALAAGELPARAGEGLAVLRDLLERFRGDFADSNDLGASFDRFIAAIGYQAEVERISADPQQALLRLAALQQLRDELRAYAQRAAKPSLEDFLEECVLGGRDEENDNDELSTANAIKLMTLHSAKGLEFPRVYLVGLEEGILPHRKSLEASEAAIAEERRLAYVGVTRAMDELTVTWCESRMKWGKRRPNILSRFVGEMRGRADDDRDAGQRTDAVSVAD
jgi:DNA helicase-2/ATP-dependent DNA helicase PcrA